MKILVPVDGSEYSGMAVEKVVDMAKKYKAEVTVLNVNSPISALFDTPKQSKKDAEAIAKKSVAPLAKARIKSKAIGAIGDPADEIITMAEKGKFDLIVMGSRGLAVSERFLVGSVTQKVVEHSPCSVLVVK